MLNIKFTYVSYTLCMKGLRGILCNIFHNFMPETELNGLKFSTCPIMLPFKKFQVSEHLVFKVMDFAFLN